MLAMADLSEREREVVRLVADALSNKMIARQLGLTEGGLKQKLRIIMLKLGCANRVEVALWAKEHGPRD